MILYHGPSMLDGREEIVGIVTDSKNSKTGPMKQLWILHANKDPFDALRAGVNHSICGHCPFQGKWNGEKTVGRVCYVNLGHGPLAVYQRFRRGGYSPGLPSGLAGTVIRLGAYGDPAALPTSLIRAICSAVSGWTGYTHQRKPSLKDFCMASADDIPQARELESKGWRVFLAVPHGENPPADYLECPFYSHGIQCQQCLLCSGNRLGAKNIWVRAHATTGFNHKWKE